MDNTFAKWTNHKPIRDGKKYTSIRPWGIEIECGWPSTIA